MDLVAPSKDPGESVLNGPVVELSGLPFPSGITHRKPSTSAGANATGETHDHATAEQSRESIENGTKEESPSLDDEGSLHSDDDWEDESLYEDALEGADDEELHAGLLADACTLQEAIEFRKQLRSLGPDRFIEETILAGTISAKKLCTAFGAMPPNFLEGSRDEAYYPLLGLGISRELQKRRKLQQYNTVDDAVTLLQRSQKIIVITGAGISTSLGIPDFRSKDTGLYSQLASKGLSEPEEVFDIGIFREDPSIFYSIAKDILPPASSEGSIRYTPTHAFIRLLQDHGKLLTNFTQNIDNIEAAAGISSDRLIQCHGSFATATCMSCGHKTPGATIYPQIRASIVPHCNSCRDRLAVLGNKRKRAGGTPDPPRKRGASYVDSDDEESEDEIGVMKPDITFFGEKLGDSFHDRILRDREEADLVIVIGTSLKVAPVAEVPRILPAEIPQIYINKTRCSHVDFDVEMKGQCDLVVSELANRLGWELSPAEDVPARIELLEGSHHSWLFSRNVTPQRSDTPSAEHATADGNDDAK